MVVRLLKRRSLRDPSLVLLDVMMPVMDGFAACLAFRQGPHLEAIPIILVSALRRVPNEATGQAGNMPLRCQTLLQGWLARLLIRTAVVGKPRPQVTNQSDTDAPGDCN
jgi:CheY-like chemotaxis protein